MFSQCTDVAPLFGLAVDSAATHRLAKTTTTNRWAYSLTTLAEMIRRHHVPVVASSIGEVVIECPIAEAIDPQRYYTLAEVEDQFGVSRSQLQRAVDSRILSGNGRGSSSIFGESLLAWIVDRDVTCTLAVSVAYQIVQARKLSRELRESKEAAATNAPPPTIGEVAGELLRRQEVDEAEERETYRQKTLEQYRDILGRRDDENDGDASLLVDIAQQLGYDAEQVERDVRILDNVTKLDESFAGKDDAIAQIAARKADVADQKKAVKNLEAAERAYLVAWSAKSTCAKAGVDASEIRSRHPDLFGGA